ncbi:restriction endonuclease subunit S [Micrococcus yunnanensis]|uniref:restriction endonuclease subunit S n=1 Tax=Micrococcus yunnanensis TaxID=566027 RepID=UPI0010716CC7|nr:restriction endonuclease subunit S [Micrococcus yunnanensis]MBF0744051.1 restriction endonuclease subunit S [Micrococcus yunnanensis]TFU56032.1 hypothetical protein E4T95_01060 [Micrococcus yunnanensis]
MISTVRLEDVLELVAMGPFGSDLKVENFTESGVPVIRGGNLGSFHVSNDGLAFVSEEKAETLARSLALPGDLVITHRGTLGQISMVPREGMFDRYLVSQSQMLVRPDPLKAHPEYLTYWLRSPAGQGALMAYSVQTGVPALAQPTKSIKSLQIPLPPLAVQKAIGEVLGALDDKIAANEAVIAAGRSLLLARWKELTQAATRTARLDEIAEIAPMTRLPKDRDLVPFVEMKNLPEHGLLVTHWTWEDRAAGTKFRNGDTLMARITPCFENGKMALVDFLEKGEVGVGSTEYIIFRPKEDIPPILPYAVIASDDYRDFAAGRRTGTSGRQRVQTAEVGEFGIRLPEPADLAQFGGFADTLLGRLGAARTENNTLARTRDELLPQLMSGRITVKDAEKRVEEEV